VKKKRRGPKVGFARGDETVDEEVESLHASATKESIATVTTESLSPAAEEDASTSSIKPISNTADSVIKDGVRQVPTTQPSKSVPVADVPADKQSTPSSSFMFDGMSLSAVKMQNPQQKEIALTSAVSTAAGTLDAVNKQNAAHHVSDKNHRRFHEVVIDTV
jgi:sorbitol-specific phosphotransferase system component IIBC